QEERPTRRQLSCRSFPEMESDQQLQHRGQYVFLDEEIFLRWSSIKFAEGVATDSEVASILIKEYDKTRATQTLESAVCCGQCNSQLSLLCGKCQPQAHTANPLFDAEDSDESQPPVVYRLLHISPKESDDNFSHDDSLAPLPARKSRRSCVYPGDPEIGVHAKEIAGAGNSIIIVDYFSESKYDVHQMCPEDSIFSAVQNSDSFAGENTVRVSLDAKSPPQYHRLQNVVPSADYQYVIQEGTMGHQLDQIGDMVTVAQTTDGDQLLQQLLYGDAAAHTLQRPDTEAASAAAALEALSSDLTFVSPPAVK
ncbi:hypothetical protein BaRGS_00010904, partial [Batillaria attramentaria]